MPRLSKHSVTWARLVLAAATVLCTTPTRATAQAKYVSPDQRTVRTFLEAKPGELNTKVVRVENLSTVPIVVTQVVLMNCNNVGLVCGLNEMETTVEPGRRKTVLEVEPAAVTRAVTFGYRFQWRHKSKEAILGTLASAGDSGAAQRLAQVQRAEAARAARPGERLLYADELVALGHQVAALRADPDTVVLAVGGASTVNAMRIIAVDSSGRSLGRVRTGYRFSLERGPAVLLARPDSLLGVSPGRQSLVMRLPEALSVGRTTPFDGVRFTIIVR
jgi:hypothetical protein